MLTSMAVSDDISRNVEITKGSQVHLITSGSITEWINVLSATTFQTQLTSTTGCLCLCVSSNEVVVVVHGIPHLSPIDSVNCDP